MTPASPEEVEKALKCVDAEVCACDSGDDHNKILAAAAAAFKRFSKEWWAVYNEVYPKKKAEYRKRLEGVDRTPFWEKGVAMVEAMLAVKE